MVDAILGFVSNLRRGMLFPRKVALMYLSRKLRKQLRVAEQVRDAGIPEQGWGPAMHGLEIGRREFYGVALSGVWAQTRALIYVYSDDKAHAPTFLELRLMDPQGKEVFELWGELSSGDMWRISEFEHLVSSLKPGDIFWLDPVESFRLAYA